MLGALCLHLGGAKAKICHSGAHQMGPLQQSHSGLRLFDTSGKHHDGTTATGRKFLWSSPALPIEVAVCCMDSHFPVVPPFLLQLFSY